MKIANINYNDLINGTGVRTSVFVSGCRHCCKNCFNQIAWDFNYGKEYTKEIEDEIIKSLEPDYIAGITILGGEPFEQENQKDLLKLLTKIKLIYPNKSIWVYSGFTFNELLEGSRASGDTCNEILNLIDVLVDGKFIEELKDISLKFKGSSNQRIIDVKESLITGKLAIYV